MKLKMILILAALNCSMAFASTTVEEQPSVVRRLLICDAWQWIGGTATTWGCATVPREAQVAGGEITDQVIESLQQQIKALEDRLNKLEGKSP